MKIKRIGISNKFLILPGIYFIKADTLVMDFPEKWKIIDEEGDEALPTGRFLISAETINPYHLVTDFFE